MSPAPITLPSVPKIRTRLNEVDHSLAVVLLQMPDGHGVAIAVVRTESGEVLAWDDYDYSFMPPSAPQALLSLDWDDWGDLPSKLALFEANAMWLGSFALWLAPEYSVARAAADLVNDHEAADDDANTRQRVRSSPVVAYFPVIDRDVFDRKLADQRS